MIFFEITKLTMPVFELTKQTKQSMAFSDKYRNSEANYAFLS